MSQARVLTGVVSKRSGHAGRNLEPVAHLILERTGLPAMAYGTLNVKLPHDYIVHDDAAIERDEYWTGERLKLQRCKVRGVQMWIMRPDSHELPPNKAADVLELLAPFHLRDTWGLENGNELAVEVEGDDAWWNEQANDARE